MTFMTFPTAYDQYFSTLDKQGQSANGLYATGEGGLFTYAVVGLDEYKDIQREKGESMPVFDTFIDFKGDAHTGGVLSQEEAEDIMSYAASAVLMGYTPQALCDENRNYYQGGEDDLTADGWAMYNLLSTMGEVKFITFLDT